MNNITNTTNPEQSELTYQVMLVIFIFMITGICMLLIICCFGSLDKKRNRIAPM